MRDPDIHVKVYAALRNEGMCDKAAYEMARKVEQNDIKEDEENGHDEAH